MTPEQLAAMEQALEALIASDDFLFNYHYCEPNNEREMDSYSLIRINNLASVTALRTIIEQAKRQQALDKMAENERELGIQMQQEPTGKAPCARHCEATAFKIMIRNLEGEISRMKAAAPVQEPSGSFLTREQAIEFCRRRRPGIEPTEQHITATIDVYAALFGDLAHAAPVQEPVAYIRKDQLQKAAQSPMLCEVTPEPRQDRIGIHTSPPASKPLTDEQIMEMYNEPRSDAEMLEFARAIEAKLREKNA